MKVSNDGINLIKSCEGCRLTSYKDSVGVWTIGYGHIKGVKPNQKITESVATEYLRQDLETAEAAVMKYDSKYHWTQNQFDALVSFAFNIGSIHQLTNYGKRSISEISSAIPLYCKAGGKTLQGLVKRRNLEKIMFDEGGAKQKEENPTLEKLEDSPQYDPGAIKAFQTACKAENICGKNKKPLTIDGMLGPNTSHALNSVRIRYGSKGELVKCLQMRINTIMGSSIIERFGKAFLPDGIFSKELKEAVTMFQVERGLSPDGIVGYKTILELLKLV